MRAKVALSRGAHPGRVDVEIVQTMAVSREQANTARSLGGKGKSLLLRRDPPTDNDDLLLACQRLMAVPIIENVPHSRPLVGELRRPRGPQRPFGSAKREGHPSGLETTPIGLDH